MIRFSLPMFPLSSIAISTHLHKTKPWIPGFKRVLIRAFHPESLDPTWVNKQRFITFHGNTYYEPTDAFWQVHANASHPPHGTGCSVDVHVAFLTEHGKNAEFEYLDEM